MISCRSQNSCVKKGAAIQAALFDVKKTWEKECDGPPSHPKGVTFLPKLSRTRSTDDVMKSGGPPPHSKDVNRKSW